MDSKTENNPQSREDQRSDSAPVRPGRTPSVIRVGVARVPSFSLTRARRRPGT